MYVVKPHNQPTHPPTSVCLHTKHQERDYLLRDYRPTFICTSAINGRFPLLRDSCTIHTVFIILSRYRAHIFPAVICVVSVVLHLRIVPTGLLHDAMVCTVVHSAAAHDCPTTIYCMLSVALNVTIIPTALLHGDKSWHQRLYCIVASALELTIVQRLFSCWSLPVDSRLSQRRYCFMTVESYLMTVPTFLFLPMRFNSPFSNDSVA